MSGNSFGNLFRLTTFGESHGPSIGGVIDGCPAGLDIDYQFLSQQMARRRPGGNAFVTARNEADEVVFLSGIFEGKTTGAPIAFQILNTDKRSVDYTAMASAIRPGHADATYLQKYGHYDYRGGGRSSARETVARLVGGSVAAMYLKQFGVVASAFVSSIGGIDIPASPQGFDLEQIEADPLRCPHPETSKLMQDLLLQLKQKGDTTGGVVTCMVRNVPAGLGEPVFNKLQAVLAHAMLSIPAARGFSLGEGYLLSAMQGSQANDKLLFRDGRIKFETNHTGGILGGISTGENIVFTVAFKPVSTLMQARETITRDGKPVVLEPAGRHDTCVVPRAVPVVEAMAFLVIMNYFLEMKARTKNDLLI
jgi:chorismate synthase